MTVNEARAEVLARIRAALGDRPDAAPIARDYRQTGAVAADPELFAERVDDYRATVHRCGGDEEAVRAAVGAVLAGRCARRVAVPDGFPARWLPEAGTSWVREPVSVAQLDAVDGVLTTCAVAIAETGTIVLDAGAGQGPRAMTLVPDYHLVVVRTGQVVALVPDAVAVLDPRRPLTWVSGPSATSDIELNRVEGVHGPRTLDVLLVGD